MNYQRPLLERTLTFRRRLSRYNLDFSPLDFKSLLEQKVNIIACKRFWGCRNPLAKLIALSYS